MTEEHPIDVTVQGSLDESTRRVTVQIETSEARIVADFFEDAMMDLATISSLLPEAIDRLLEDIEEQRTNGQEGNHA